MRKCIVGLLALSLLLGVNRDYAQINSAASAIAVLKINGSMEFSRQGWTTRQPLLAGTLVSPADLIFPHDATILVMCPDGSVREFLSSDLIPNSHINCPASAANYIVGQSGQKRINIRRGGTQSPAVPYVISPRKTVVRTPNIDIIWNPIPNVQAYFVTLYDNTRKVWISDPLDPANVTDGGVASVAVPQILNEKTPYTVEICARFSDSYRHCTTDADWSTDDNLAFYYVPTPALDSVEAQLATTLGADTPESLYARAILFSQPVYQASADTQLGVNSEAITLLEELIKDHADSALATSPDLYTLLGNLYSTVGLPLSAARVYQHAEQLAAPDTEIAADAALGLALTSPDGETSVKSYNQALDNYSAFLSKDAFQTRLTELCDQIGDLKFDVDRCAAQ